MCTVRGISATIAVVVTSLVLASCGSEVNSDSSTSPTAVSAGSSSKKPDTDFGNIAGQFPQTPDVSAPDIRRGDCVALTGSAAHSSLSVVECGSTENNYRVVQITRKPWECVNDADQHYYKNKDGSEFSLCLDYAWGSKDCLLMSDHGVTRSKCEHNAAGRVERPLTVVENASNITVCPTGGYPHPTRRFVVCAESI
ncbi:putative lipoprotein LppU [Mycobacteroides stephanolepidis]|uniref:Putative lipoprotein LppU n=1 Tax=[Mycobacterium] stephanolepidis TaxID=1520670 RepID=A0A1Z4EW18_9MYCO|nr:putative lipoprotein LppU [[Mycobacterium] stephanolepidis]